MLSTDDYIEYLESVAKKIAENKDYITELDATTGDGDHWVNMNMGFEKILSSKDELKNLKFNALLKKIGMIMMSTIGGSSGALYGSAYISAAKRVGDTDSLDNRGVLSMLEAELKAIMQRGKAKFGDKTMIDSLYPAVEKFKEELEKGSDDDRLFNSVIKAAQEGMLETKNMEATKGRASYREDKGVGHLDPGAVTMFYQIEELMKYLLNKK